MCVHVRVRVRTCACTTCACVACVHVCACATCMCGMCACECMCARLCLCDVHVWRVCVCDVHVWHVCVCALPCPSVSSLSLEVGSLSGSTRVLCSPLLLPPPPLRGRVQACSRQLAVCGWRAPAPSPGTKDFWQPRFTSSRTLVCVTPRNSAIQDLRQVSGYRFSRDLRK